MILRDAHTSGRPVLTRRACLGLLVGALGATGAACRQAPASASTPRTVTFTIHPLQHARMGNQIKAVIEQAVPGLTVTLHDAERGLDYVNALQEGTADFAFVSADVAYLSFAGQLGGPPADRLRGVAVLDTTPIYFIVPADSPVREPADLRDLRVSVGVQQSISAITSGILLDGLQVPIHAVYEPFTAGLPALARGERDAVIIVASYPVDAIQAALRQGQRLVSLTEPAVDRIHDGHPFLRPVVIPAGIYGDQRVLSVGPDRVFVCRDGLDADLVYEVTRAFFTGLPTLAQVDGPLRQMNVEESSATPLPLHPGAARYFREQE